MSEYFKLYQEYVDLYGEDDNLKFGHQEISLFMRKEFIISIDQTDDYSTLFCFLSDIPRYVVLILFKDQEMDMRMVEIKK